MVSALVSALQQNSCIGLCIGLCIATEQLHWSLPWSLHCNRTAAFVAALVSALASALQQNSCIGLCLGLCIATEQLHRSLHWSLHCNRTVRRQVGRYRTLLVLMAIARIWKRTSTSPATKNGFVYLVGHESNALVLFSILVLAGKNGSVVRMTRPPNSSPPTLWSAPPV